jgi:hypothetical protein
MQTLLVHKFLPNVARTIDSESGFVYGTQGPQPLEYNPNDWQNHGPKTLVEMQQDVRATFQHKFGEKPASRKKATYDSLKSKGVEESAARSISGYKD